MYRMLIVLMLISASIELGFSLKDVSDCTSRRYKKRIDHAARRVLGIDWKPISVFPEEAKRFR